MSRTRKLTLWILPILGLLLGYAWAYVDFNGLLQPWHNAGRPEEKITRINSIEEDGRLIVQTETGKYFSLSLDYEGEALLPEEPSWDKAQPVPAAATAQKDWGADFASLPPPFPVEQLYKAEYLYKVEGKGEVRAALGEDGNIWLWNHQSAGLAGLVFAFHPVIGFSIGIMIVLAVSGVSWSKTTRRLVPQKI